MTKTKLSRADFLVGGVATAVVIGWLIHFSQDGFDLFGSWFATLSFGGSLLVALFVLGQPFGLVKLPGDWGRKLLPILSLVPLAGFLIEMVTPLDAFLREGGTIALAYLSATTFWRKQFLDLARREPTSEKKKAPDGD